MRGEVNSTKPRSSNRFPFRNQRTILTALGMVFCIVASNAVRLGTVAYAHNIPVPPGQNGGPPWPTESLYMHTIDSSIIGLCYQGGAAQGDRSTYDMAHYTPSIARPYNGTVVLDFGRPDLHNGVYGTRLFTTNPPIHATQAQIEACVERYAWGFYGHTPPLNQNPPILRITIGTSNNLLDDPADNGGVDAYQHGAMWGRLVNDVANYVHSYSGLASQITIAGADDIELSWSHHDGQNGVDRWLSGYNSTAQHTYHDYGDASACYPIINNPLDLCANGWHQEDVYWVAKGAPWARALPEIYFGIPPQSDYDINAKQWQKISLAGYVYHSGLKVIFAGELTEFNDCGGCNNTPQQGWTQLQDMLFNNDPGGHGYLNPPSPCTTPPNCHRTDQSIGWSTDIGNLP